MISIYHNPRCTKSRQTLELLKEQGIEPKVIEYLKELPSKQELKDVIKLLKIKPIDLVRRTESVYKDQFKGKELSDEEWINAMLQYPKLIQRPIVINGKKAALGRPPENVLEII